MRNVRNYFCVEAKRSAKLIASSVLGLLVLMAVTVAGIWGIHSGLEKTRSLARITVGVAVDKDDDTTSFLTQMLSGMDSVRSVCDFQFMDEKQAKEQVQTGEIQVAILLPKDFYEDVDTGVNTPVSVFFSWDASFSTDVFAELLKDGVSLVQITEAGVYAASDLGQTHAMTMSRGSMQDFLSLLYLEAVYGRGASFDSCVLSETGEINLNQYYLVAGELFLVLMAGVVFVFFYRRRDRAAEEKLALMGVGSVWQSAVKICLMSLYIYVFMAGIYALTIFWADKTDFVYLEYEAFVLKALPVLAFSIAGFFHGILSIFRDKGGIGLLLTNGVLFVCAGGFLPIVYFPKWIQEVGKHLPLSYWMQSLSQILFGSSYRMNLLPMLLIGIIFSFVGIIAKCVRT